MKTINQDTIEFAEDFFFKLSDTQLKERKDEFRERQPMVDFYFRGVKLEFENEFQDEVLWKFALMVDYCFKNSFGPIPMISKQKISDRLAWIVKDINDNPEPSGNVNYPKNMAQAGQVPMLKVIEARCEAYILAYPNFPESKATDVFDNIIIMTWLYQQEVM